MAVHVLACNKRNKFTFPRRYRLTRREGFSRILHQRAKINSWFAVHTEVNMAGHARLGMTVSKRILPASTQRNAAKRLIRECFRSLARQGKSQDVVIRLRKPLNKKDIYAAKAALSELLGSVLVVK